MDPRDPYSLRASKREDDDNNKRKSILKVPSHGKARGVKKYYNRQNALIDAYLNSSEEEATEVEDTLQNGWKVKLAVNGSFSVNFFLFIIQIYAAVSTGSLSLFGTAADAFMDLVSSIVMLITSRLAAKPNIRKFPVGRKRVETVGIILFCALMTTVAVELIIESARALASGPKNEDDLKLIPLLFVGIAIFSKSIMFVYCFLIRRYPAAGIFMLDHRNDIFVNIFGLVMSIIGTKFKKVWFLDPIGAICIACLILFSWASTAFEHMWFLVGKSAPQDFLNKLVYVSVTHDSRIQKIDTARAYHAGDKYYVEVDIIMGQEERLKVTHDVAERLQRKLEGLADVERAFVHVDYDGIHDISEEHKPLYEPEEPKAPLVERVREKLKFKSRTEAVSSV
ncbi:cation efflux family-domain-containing protein [Hyaloscypha sp. PMI_1271]|nr:cation efflux family-domain-containing protein [Hyaloscypha sp. PMI_1271]